MLIAGTIDGQAEIEGACGDWRMTGLLIEARPPNPKSHRDGHMVRIKPSHPLFDAIFCGLSTRHFAKSINDCLDEARADLRDDAA
jgi:hypothetical protein